MKLFSRDSTDGFLAAQTPQTPQTPVPSPKLQGQAQFHVALLVMVTQSAGALIR